MYPVSTEARKDAWNLELEYTVVTNHVGAKIKMDSSE